MKGHQNHHNHHLPIHKKILLKLKHITNLQKNTYKSTPYYFFLLILFYTLGYLTSSFTPPILITPPNKHSFSILNKNAPHNQFGPKCSDPIPPHLIRPTLLKKIYNNISPYHNFPPAHWAHLLKPKPKPKTLLGWGSNGTVFETLIKKTRPETIIEIGSFLGSSATHMSDLTRKLGLETQILCIDDFRGWPGFLEFATELATENGDVSLLAQFMQNVVSDNFTEVILPVPFSSGITLHMFCEWGVMADLIEVDAGHDFHSAWLDINLAYKLLKKGGVIFGHDWFNSVDRKGVRRAVKLFARVYGFNVSVDGEHWVIQ